MQNTESIISNIGTVFTIISVILSIIKVCIDKFLPYVKTKIQKNVYYNVKVWMWLIYYEMFVSIIAVLIAGVLAVVLGKNSTWEGVALGEHVIALLVIWWIYIIGIVWIIYKKRESVVCKFIENILWATVMYVIAAVSFWNPLGENGPSILYGAGIYITIFLQFFCDIDVQKVGNIQYEIETLSGRRYSDCSRIVRKGDFYILCYENNKKMVELPIGRIKVIQTKMVDVEQKKYILNGSQEKMKKKSFYKEIKRSSLLKDDVAKRKGNIVDEIKKCVDEKTTEERISFLDGILFDARKRQEAEILIVFLSIIFIIMSGITFAILNSPVIVYFLIITMVVMLIVSIHRIKVIRVRGFIEAVILEHKDSMCAGPKKEQRVDEKITEYLE